MKEFSTILPSLYRRQSFLMAGTLLLSVSPLLCTVLYLGAALASILNWRQINFNRERITIASLITLLSIGFLFRNNNPENFFPGWISLSDYLPFFIFFFILSLSPFSKSEIEKFFYALILTIPQQFMLAVGENYLGWNGRYFWKDKVQIFDISVGSSVLGIKTSAGFFNPNILACYCVLCAGICLNLLMVSVKSLNLNSNINLRQCIKIAVPFIGLIMCTILIVWSESNAGLMTLILMSIIWVSWKSRKFLYLGIFSSLFTFLCFLALSNFGWFTQVSAFLIPQSLLALLNSALASWIDRLPYYQCAIQLIQEKPFIGWGIRNFFPECSSRMGMEMVHAHNIVLQLGADVGLPFTTLVLVLVGYIFFSCFRFFREAKLKETKTCRLASGCLIVVLSLILMQLFDLGLLMSYRLNFLFWICLAIPYSLASQPKSSEPI